MLLEKKFTASSNNENKTSKSQRSTPFNRPTPPPLRYWKHIFLESFLPAYQVSGGEIPNHNHKPAIISDSLCCSNLFGVFPYDLKKWRTESLDDVVQVGLSWLCSATFEQLLAFGAIFCGSCDLEQFLPFFAQFLGKTEVLSTYQYMENMHTDVRVLRVKCDVTSYYCCGFWKFSDR